MTEHAHIIRVSTFIAADGRLDDLIAATQSNAGDAAAAEGCFGAQVCEIPDQPGVLAVISRWRDRAALDQFLGWHEGTAHGRVAGLLQEPPKSVHYSSLPAATA